MKKKLGLIFLITLAVLFNSYITAAQEYKDNEIRELNFNSGKKVFIIKNLFGRIKIEAIDGNKGQLDIEKAIITGKKEDYERAKEELKVMIENNGDTILVYLDAPYINIKRHKGGISYCIDHLDKDYEFRIDFTVKIPRDAEIDVSTVNDGDINVNGICAKMTVNNVNGGIELKNIDGEAYVNTVNGEINVDFKENPQENCEFKNINGDINIFCDKNLSANVNYKTMNGDFYTNYDISAVEPEKMKETRRMEGSTFYKLGMNPGFRIGQGKIKMSFETINGNMTVKYKE